MEVPVLSSGVHGRRRRQHSWTAALEFAKWRSLCLALRFVLSELKTFAPGLGPDTLTYKPQLPALLHKPLRFQRRVSAS